MTKTKPRFNVNIDVASPYVLPTTDTLFREEYMNRQALAGWEKWEADAPGADDLRWLVDYVRLETGQSVHVHPDPSFWYDPTRSGFHVPAEVGTLLHEFCHWLVASDAERHRENHGLVPDTAFARRREWDALALEWAFIERSDAPEPPGWPWTLFPLVTRDAVEVGERERNIVDEHFGVAGLLDKLHRTGETR